MTNSHEGDLFVDEKTLAATNVTLAEYVANLFPRMNESSIRAGKPKRSLALVGEHIACPVKVA